MVKLEFMLTGKMPRSFLIAKKEKRNKKNRNVTDDTSISGDGTCFSECHDVRNGFNENFADEQSYLDNEFNQMVKNRSYEKLDSAGNTPTSGLAEIGDDALMTQDDMKTNTQNSGIPIDTNSPGSSNEHSHYGSHREEAYISLQKSATQLCSPETQASSQRIQNSHTPVSSRFNLIDNTQGNIFGHCAADQVFQNEHAKPLTRKRKSDFSIESLIAKDDEKVYSPIKVPEINTSSATSPGLYSPMIYPNPYNLGLTTAYTSSEQISPIPYLPFHWNNSYQLGHVPFNDSVRHNGYTTPEVPREGDKRVVNPLVPKRILIPTSPSHSVPQISPQKCTLGFSPLSRDISFPRIFQTSPSHDSFETLSTGSISPKENIPVIHPNVCSQKTGSNISHSLEAMLASSRERLGDIPRYNCEKCGKTYSTFSGLSKHTQFHCNSEAKKQFNCKYCDKTYTSLGALKMHIRTHTLPCKCKICGKAFSRPWLLQGHVRTHTGEKPFNCVHCGRAFADRSNLRAHLQTHTDVKKYSCKNCTKTFSRMSLLLKHEDGGCAMGN